MWRSWDRPVSYRVYSTQTSHYSFILNKNEHGYGEMLHRWKSCLRAIAPLNHLHPLNSQYYPLSQWEQHQHWWKRFIQRLVKQQHANTLSLLQAYQAELLADLDEGGGIAFSTTEDKFSWLGMAWDSTSMQARMSPAREESILSAMKSIRLRPVTPCQTCFRDC